MHSEEDAMLYVPGSFRESDVAVMQEFIRRYPFATVVSYRDGIHVSHLPVWPARMRTGAISMARLGRPACFMVPTPVSHPLVYGAAGGADVELCRRARDRNPDGHRRSADEPDALG